MSHSIAYMMKDVGGFVPKGEKSVEKLFFINSKVKSLVAATKSFGYLYAIRQEISSLKRVATDASAQSWSSSANSMSNVYNSKFERLR